jgi:hypothetical protein
MVKYVSHMDNNIRCQIDPAVLCFGLFVKFLIAINQEFNRLIYLLVLTIRMIVTNKLTKRNGSESRVCMDVFCYGAVKKCVV